MIEAQETCQYLHCGEPGGCPDHPTMSTLWGVRIEQPVLNEIESIRKSFLESLPRQVQPTHLMLVLPAIAWCVREIAALRKRHEVPYR